MNISSAIPLAEDISAIRENYDTNNPVIAEILKAKEERLKILNELFNQDKEEYGSSDILLRNDLKNEKKSAVKKSRKSDTVFSVSTVRRSTRLQNSPKAVYKEDKLSSSLPLRNQIIRPPNEYGEVPGVEIGTHWETRMECSLFGVHRPTVAGIHGGPQGAYSIALSGGYPEDIDEGDYFIYTGAGGRDLKGTAAKPKNLRTAPQTKDQQLEGTNLSLVKSIESRLPVRVIRGYKSTSIFAPETGYRYDGLYRVVKYWEDVGKAGYRIYRFRMERIKNQPPPPWENNVNISPRIKLKTDQDELLEFKENIVPEINDSNINSKDVKDIDNEIKLCIDFFCKGTSVRCNKEIEKDSGEEEFHGWE